MTSKLHTRPPRKPHPSTVQVYFHQISKNDPELQLRSDECARTILNWWEKQINLRQVPA